MVIRCLKYSLMVGKGCDNMSIGNIVTIITEVVTLIGFVVGFVVWVRKLTNGMKCQLRTDMLKTYYHNRETGKIRQYEFENFVFNYEAYKALKGNSFIDEIYEKIKKWEIVSQESINMKNKLLKLFEVKSIVTLCLTIGLLLLLTGIFNPPDAIFALYSTTYGSVITYFFTRKNTDKEGE